MVAVCIGRKLVIETSAILSNKGCLFWKKGVEMKHFLVVLGLMGALSLPVDVVAESIQTSDCVLVERNYGDKMAEKAESGIVNITTGILELPKNTINTVNESDNIVFGIIGGAIKGSLHTAGRISAGVADLLTFFVPTEPISQPEYVWQDFDTDTTYGKVLRLSKDGRVCQQK